jgi:hypothetical protein
VDAGFKERVTAAFDGLAARYDTERGGFFGPVSDLLARAAGLRPGGVFAFSWNVAEDPAWVPVIAAMDDHAADGGFCGFLHRPPFDAVPAMEAMLRRAGYRGIGTTQRVAEVRYASPDAWWEASWNQAPALFWGKIPEPELRAARARAVALLEPLRAPDGSLRRGLGFCYTRAAAA